MVPLQMWFKETRALIGRGLNCIFPHSTSAPFPSNYDTTKHIFKIVFRKQPLFLQAKGNWKGAIKGLPWLLVISEIIKLSICQV